MNGHRALLHAVMDSTWPAHKKRDTNLFSVRVRSTQMRESNKKNSIDARHSVRCSASRCEWKIRNVESETGIL